MLVQMYYRPFPWTVYLGQGSQNAIKKEQTLHAEL